MYNYLSNGVTLNATIMDAINEFNKVARTLATESVEHTTAKKTLETAIAGFIKEEKAEDAKKAQIELDNLETAWTARRKELEKALFGGKDGDAKVVGICDIVSNDLYKAYVASVKDNKNNDYRHAMYEFCKSIINEDTIKDGAFNHMYIDIKTTMSSVRYNSNSQLAQGACFITTVNKRVYKKMLLGAIADIVSNNHTLKVKKESPKKNKKNDKATTTK